MKGKDKYAHSLWENSELQNSYSHNYCQCIKDSKKKNKHKKSECYTLHGLEHTIFFLSIAEHCCLCNKKKKQQQHKQNQNQTTKKFKKINQHKSWKLLWPRISNNYVSLNILEVSIVVLH